MNCPSCGFPTEAPGECGFCVEEQTGRSITEERLTPSIFATNSIAHRLLVARFHAEEGRGESLFCESAANSPGANQHGPTGLLRCRRGHLREGANLGSEARCRTCERERKRAARAAKGAQPGANRQPLLAAA